MKYIFKQVFSNPPIYSNTRTYLTAFACDLAIKCELKNTADYCQNQFLKGARKNSVTLRTL